MIEKLVYKVMYWRIIGKVLIAGNGVGEIPVHFFLWMNGPIMGLINVYILFSFAKQISNNDLMFCGDQKLVYTAIDIVIKQISVWKYHCSFAKSKWSNFCYFGQYRKYILNWWKKQTHTSYQDIPI